jgi:phage shock protein C
MEEKCDTNANMLEHLKNRTLYRSPREAMVFGICAGLGHYLQVDTVFVRLVVIALAFLSQGWPVLVLYIIAAFVVPIDPAQDTVASHQAVKEVKPQKHKEEKKAEKMDSDQNM